MKRIVVDHFLVLLLLTFVMAMIYVDSGLQSWMSAVFKTWILGLILIIVSTIYNVYLDAKK